MDNQKLTVRCCIAGGGPAGMMLGYLLARAGIETVVLEKWPDFFRDFRGDTIHPSTMDILNELDLLDFFLTLPHNKNSQLQAEVGAHKVVIADFSYLNVCCPYIAFIPQWDFLTFLSSKAKQYPHFKLMLNTEVFELIEEKDRVIGVRAKSGDKAYDIYAELVVGADGRHSLVRQKSGLVLDVLSSPMDVLWFRLSRQETDPDQSLGRIDLGRIMIMIERGHYWQCGFIIPKGGFIKIREAGLDAFQQSLLEVVPTMAERVKEIKTWDQVKLLEVSVNRLQKWHREGLLCIGDAAHTMSPIGGVGINLAIQDAVASANILVPAFLQGVVTEAQLKAIQQRRELPTRVIQKIQVLIQDRIIHSVLGKRMHPKLPLILKLFNWIPWLRRIPAYVIGIGFRPEHIRSAQRPRTPE